MRRIQGRNEKNQAAQKSRPRRTAGSGFCVCQKVFLTRWWTGSKLSTIRNGHPAAPGGLQCSRLSVQHGRSASSHRPALTLARCSVAAHCALLRVLATPALRASDVRKLTRGAPCFTGLIGSYCTLNSQWSSCCALRLAVLLAYCLLRPVSRTARGLRAPTGCAASFALIGLTPRCFVPLFAIVALLRYRLQVSFCSLDFRFACFAHCAASSVPTGRALRAPLAPPAASRPPIVYCASLRVLATSALRASDVRKLTRGFLCLTGLTTACFRHWRRPSCAPFPFGKKKALGQGYFIR